MKIIKFIVLLIITIVCGFTIILFEIKVWPAGSSIAGIIIGFSFPALCKAFQDLTDTTNWKVSQTQLKRGGFIKNDTIIRISFAYLYRIKIGNKYLLVKNSRNTNKYQPVGGVYKMSDNEKIILKNSFQVKDDDKIPIDESSRSDYRLRLENRNLRKFIKRFDRKAERERINDAGREFKEELIDTGILNWNEIEYRYCGRHITNLKFEEHFQIYELQLADIIELMPNEKQEQDLKKMINVETNEYKFASAEQITCLGIDIDNGRLEEWIGDHTKKILQEEEDKLMKVSNVGTVYNIRL